MTIFFLFDVFVTILGSKGPIMKHFFKGRPIVVIYNGKLHYKNLKKSKLDVNDIIGMSREKGYFDITDIAFAVFENSGKLSIMPKSNLKPVVSEDINKSLPPASLPYYLIVDGNISYSSLRELNKDENWLYQKTKLNKKALKHILLAVYDLKNDEVEIQLK